MGDKPRVLVICLPAYGSLLPVDLLTILGVSVASHRSPAMSPRLSREVETQDFR